MWLWEGGGGGGGRGYLRSSCFGMLTINLTFWIIKPDNQTINSFRLKSSITSNIRYFNKIFLQINCFFLVQNLQIFRTYFGCKFLQRIQACIDKFQTYTGRCLQHEQTKVNKSKQHNQPYKFAIFIYGRGVGHFTCPVSNYQTILFHLSRKLFRFKLNSRNRHCQFWTVNINLRHDKIWKRILPGINQN